MLTFSVGDQLMLVGMLYAVARRVIRLKETANAVASLGEPSTDHESILEDCYDRIRCIFCATKLRVSIAIGLRVEGVLWLSLHAAKSGALHSREVRNRPNITPQPGLDVAKSQCW